MLIQLHPDNPQPRNLRTIRECLSDGGIIIYPTDTIYGLGCDIFQHKAIERICRIKNIDPQKAQLSFVCHDLSDLSKYSKKHLHSFIPAAEKLPSWPVYFYLTRKQGSAQNFKK